MWSIGQTTRERKKGEIKAEGEKKSVYTAFIFIW